MQPISLQKVQCVSSENSIQSPQCYVHCFLWSPQASALASQQSMTLAEIDVMNGRRAKESHAGVPRRTAPTSEQFFTGKEAGPAGVEETE